MSGKPPVVLPRLESAPRDEVSIGRWAKAGCIVGVVFLLVALFAAFLLFDRGVRMVAGRAMQQIRNHLPAELTPAEQERTRTNLDLLERELDRRSDPGELISAFLREAAPALEDRRLTADEVEAVNTCIEQALGLPSPTPPPAGQPSTGGP